MPLSETKENEDKDKNLFYMLLCISRYGTMFRCCIVSHMPHTHRILCYAIDMIHMLEE